MGAEYQHFLSLHFLSRHLQSHLLRDQVLGWGWRGRWGRSISIFSLCIFSLDISRAICSGTRFWDGVGEADGGGVSAFSLSAFSLSTSPEPSAPGPGFGMGLERPMGAEYQHFLSLHFLSRHLQSH